LSKSTESKSATDSADDDGVCVAVFDTIVVKPVVVVAVVAAVVVAVDVAVDLVVVKGNVDNGSVVVGVVVASVVVVVVGQVVDVGSLVVDDENGGRLVVVVVVGTIQERIAHVQKSDGCWQVRQFVSLVAFDWNTHVPIRAIGTTKGPPDSRFRCRLSDVSNDN
jgi:hypothetical protein